MAVQIDLSRIPAPDALETLDFEEKLAGLVSTFQGYWAEARLKDPTLPEYDVEVLETDPAMILMQAVSYVRLLDRGRVNDAIKALLAPLSQGADLENLVVSRNLTRSTIREETSDEPAIMESDLSLLRRYLYSFDAPAAGSAGRYLFDAYSGWPQSDDATTGLLHAQVNGRKVHGRAGDTDVVLIGPGGRLLTDEELALVSASVRHADRTPEAVNVSVMNAQRSEYDVSLVLEVPGSGPAPEVLRTEAMKRITAMAQERTLIGGEIPEGVMLGAAYGESIIKVRDLTPVILASDPYTVPVLRSLSLVIEVRS